VGYYAQLGQLRVDAPSVDEALGWLRRRIDGLVGDVGQPRAFRLGGRMAVVGRDLYGWAYCLIEDGQRHAPCWGMGYDSAEEAERRARWHAAQLAPTLEEGLSLLQCEEDRAELIRYWAWQDGYRRARAAGAADDEARRAADEARLAVGAGLC
jgi:hypothetical protein